MGSESVVAIDCGKRGAGQRHAVTAQSLLATADGICRVELVPIGLYQLVSDDDAAEEIGSESVTKKQT
jgi:hypothetical protein